MTGTTPPAARRPPLTLRLTAGARRVAARVVSPQLRESGPVLALLSLLATMTAGDVVDIVRLLQGAEVQVWVAGGWGVDALVGRRTRRHEDVDLLVPREQSAAALEALSARGFAPVRSSVVPAALLPERVILADPRGRTVDLHPVDLAPWLTETVAARLPDAPDPGGAAFAEGSLDGAPVPCLSRELQLAAHEGYEQRAVDARDVALLRGHGPR
jgi:lincosamide nucleotidyltransferase A/C/D/E